MRELRRTPWLIRYAYGARAASEARRLAALATHRHANLRIDTPVWLGPGFSLWMPGHEATLHIGANSEFRRNFLCEVSGQGEVIIGPSCIFTGTARIQCSTTIRLGEGVIVSSGVVIVDGNHRFRDPGVRILDQGYDFRPVEIGQGALIHSNCTIVNSIGERAVIGANSVVTRPIPAYSLAVGCPARVVDYFGPAEHAAAEVR